MGAMFCCGREIDGELNKLIRELDGDSLMSVLALHNWLDRFISELDIKKINLENKDVIIFKVNILE